MTAETEILRSEDSKLGQLTAIFYLLQANLEQMQDEVDRSYELLKIGEKTDFSKKIEKSLNNPIEHILLSSSKFKSQVDLLLDKIVLAFFIHQKDKIYAVYRGINTIEGLNYSIVLEEDTIENRTLLFSFFDIFNDIENTSNHNIYFQFIPKKFADKISNSIKLEIN